MSKRLSVACVHSSIRAYVDCYLNLICCSALVTGATIF